MDILLGAIVSGGIYASVSLGFALAFRISRIFNMAHGILLVAAAYINYALQSNQYMDAWLAIPLSILIMTACGAAIEAFLIPFAKSKGLEQSDLLILSWLMLVIGQDVLSMTFSSKSIYMGAGPVEPGWLIFGIRATPLQLAIIVLSVGAAGILHIFLNVSGFGRAVKAVGDNAKLATICGVNVRRVVVVNGLLSAFLTTGAGILLSYQERIDPLLGFRFSIIAIVSTLAGGAFGPSGAVVGAFVLALFESTVLYLVDPGLRNAAVYVGLLAVLLWTYGRQSIPDQG